MKPELRDTIYFETCKQFLNRLLHLKEIPKELLTFFLALHGTSSNVSDSWYFDKEEKTNLVTNLSNDGKQYSLQYERFVPMLIKSVQELSEQVETLKDEIEELKG